VLSLQLKAPLERLHFARYYGICGHNILAIQVQALFMPCERSEIGCCPLPSYLDRLRAAGRAAADSASLSGLKGSPARLRASPCKTRKRIDS